jgi:hypothetical protein
MAKKKLDQKLEKSGTSTLKAKKTSKGFGDTVEKVFKATGIDKVAKWILGEDCGCEERKEKLNKMFPYIKPQCLTEDEYTYLDKHFKAKKSQITIEEQVTLINIYGRVFPKAPKVEPTSCSPCFVNNVLRKLEDIYIHYNA